MKMIIALIIALALLGGCKEDQTSSSSVQGSRIYHTDQPKEQVPDGPVGPLTLLGAGSVLILAHRVRYR
jgi:hypothetical protein